MTRRWKVLIVDDEPLGRRRLVLACEGATDLEIVGEAVDGTTAKAMIDALAPDIVLLDIQMPGLSGLEVCAAEPDRPPERAFIFVTAHERFARDAFDVAAIDYLLKPFSIERFQQALVRAKRWCEQAHPTAEPAHQTDQRAPVKDDKSYLAELWISNRHGKQRLSVCDIDWIGAERDYSRIYMGTEGLLYGESLGRLGAQLDPREFLRVHRSALVRLAAIRQILRGAEGQIQLLTSARDPVPVGRRYASKLRRTLMGLRISAHGDKDGAAYNGRA